MGGSYEVAGGRASSALVGRAILLLALFCCSLQSAPHWGRATWQTPGSGFLDELARFLLPSHSLQERQNREQNYLWSFTGTEEYDFWVNQKIRRRWESSPPFTCSLLLISTKYLNLDSPPLRCHLWFPTGLAASLHAPCLYPKANISLRETWFHSQLEYKARVGRLLIQIRKVF